jgi:serine O-acetyltransferase
LTTRDFIRRKASVMSRALDELMPTFQTRGVRPPTSALEPYPSESEVRRVLSLLDDVFYPGYRSHWDPADPIETLVIERLDEAYDTLHRQIVRALPLRWSSEYAQSLGEAAPKPLDANEVQVEAERLVGAFFERLPRVRETLKRDVAAAYNGDPAAKSYMEVIQAYPGLRAITTHRVAHELYLLEIPLIPRLMNEDMHRRTGIEIHPGARIGESFFIDHGTGVVVGETTLIGDRVKLYQGVSLGAFSFKLDEAGHPVKGGKRHPTIEDDVVIYAGATILGGETVIGKGSVIGSNVWLTRSVPPNTTVTLKNQAQF